MGNMASVGKTGSPANQGGVLRRVLQHESHGSGQLHPDGLEFGVLVVRENGFVATEESGLLEAAERFTHDHRHVARAGWGQPFHIPCQSPQRASGSNAPCPERQSSCNR